MVELNSPELNASLKDNPERQKVIKNEKKNKIKKEMNGLTKIKKSKKVGDTNKNTNGVAKVLKKKASKMSISSNTDDKIDAVSEPPKKKKKLDKQQNDETGNQNNEAEAALKKPKLNENSPECLGDFSKFQISSQTKQLLKKKGINYLFPIQIKTFNHILEGKDVIAQARTGTGKTLAFAVPVIEKLLQTDMENERGRPPRVLVLAPTRELVLQVFNDFAALSRKLKSLSIYGGTPYYPQELAMRNGVDIVVGTPGRITDHIEKGNLFLNMVDHVVLDEVDQMLDMGFSEAVEEILSHAYTNREKKPQTLLFSATCPHWVERTARKYMTPSTTVRVDTIGSSVIRTATTVEHLAIRCNFSELQACIGGVVQMHSGQHGRALIFTDTKKEANELVMSESLKQHKAQVLHGDIEQKQREITLKAFRNGTIRCLVATNVAARGLDIPEVDLVIQTSPPQDIDSYIHRSGRTGRAGRTGVSVCFYPPKNFQALRKVERLAGITFKQVGPPQPEDILKASCKDAMTSIKSVDKKLIKQFMESANTVAEATEDGALGALAGALAYMSGATSLTSRSLLDARPNFRTWRYVSIAKVYSSSIFAEIQKQLGSEIRNLVTNLRMQTDEKGAVFDLPDEWTDEIQDTWKSGQYTSLNLAESLPDLKEQQRTFFGGWQNNSGGRGGYGGRGRNYGGGFKRGGRGGNFRNQVGSNWRRSKYL